MLFSQTWHPSGAILLYCFGLGEESLFICSGTLEYIDQQGLASSPFLNVTRGPSGAIGTSANMI